MIVKGQEIAAACLDDQRKEGRDNRQSQAIWEEP